MTLDPFEEKVSPPGSGGPSLTPDSDSPLWQEQEVSGPACSGKGIGTWVLCHKPAPRERAPAAFLKWREKCRGTHFDAATGEQLSVCDLPRTHNPPETPQALLS